jgi:Putative MetA-pathway of phenol degradation
MGGIPVGDYQQGRMANIGINHYSIDGGGGYIYLDATKGHEISVTGGLTYNFENNDTHYKNGVDSHLDWGLAVLVREDPRRGGRPPSKRRAIGSSRPTGSGAPRAGRPAGTYRCRCCCRWEAELQAQFYRS